MNGRTTPKKEDPYYLGLFLFAIGGIILALDILKNIPNWICWKIIKRKTASGITKTVKLPINPHSGKAASATDPKTWGTYNQARHAYKKFYGMSGLGFVFTEEVGVVGVDLDHCIMDNGKLAPVAQAIVDLLQSYTEYSPSGKGLHIYVFGKIPHNIKRNIDGVEVYGSLRYFTVTGKPYPGTVGEICHRQSEIMKIIDQYTEKSDVCHQQITPDEIREMLSVIPNNGLDYDRDWIRILMAIHSVYPGSTGVQLAKEWCESTSGPGEIEAKFLSFKRKGVGIGTLRYIAKQWGWKPKYDPLDRVFPPLTPDQKRQVQQIIDQVVEERLWEVYHNQIDNRRIAQFGLPERVVDHYQIGYRDRTIDKETGEIMEPAYTIPFFSTDGTVVDIEYRMDGNRYEYTVPYASLFYALPMLGEEDDPTFAVIVPDSVCAINTYMRFGQMEIGNNKMGVWGLPHTDLEELSLAQLDEIDRVVFVLDRNIDPRQFISHKDRARFLTLPIPAHVALKTLSKAEVKRMLNQAQPLQAIL